MYCADLTICRVPYTFFMSEKGEYGYPYVGLIKHGDLSVYDFGQELPALLEMSGNSRASKWIGLHFDKEHNQQSLRQMFAEEVIPAFTEPAITQFFIPSSPSREHHYVLLRCRIDRGTEKQHIYLSLFDSVRYSGREGEVQILVDALNARTGYSDRELGQFEFLPDSPAASFPLLQPDRTSCGVYTVFLPHALSDQPLPSWVLDRPFNVRESRRLTLSETHRMVFFLALKQAMLDKTSIKQIAEPGKPKLALDDIGCEAFYFTGDLSLRALILQSFALDYRLQDLQKEQVVIGQTLHLAPCAAAPAAAAGGAAAASAEGKEKEKEEETPCCVM